MKSKHKAHTVLTLSGESEPVDRGSVSDAFMLSHAEQFYSDGDKSSLLFALNLCLSRSYRIPQWVRDGMATAIDSVYSGEVTSWDAVFGPAKEKSRKGRRFGVAHKVLEKLVIARSREINTPIDGYLFEVIGKDLGISGSKARDYYYEHFGPKAGKKPSSKK